MKCPKCRGIDLERKAFNSPYVCQACEGMWLHSDQFSLLADSTEAVAPDNTPNDKDNMTGLCPEGHGVMTRAKVDVESPFYLEKCLHCGGIWFDKGEWHRVAQARLAENIDVIWSAAWQRKQRLEKAEEKNSAKTKSPLAERKKSLISSRPIVVKN